MKKLNQDHSGFTIIEVVLVLAIAGLIFMMVFIALPALQRNQRDIQRKNDVNHALAALQRYQANNKGNLPSGDYWEGFTLTYLRAGGDGFQDPDGSDYGFWRNPDRNDIGFKASYGSYAGRTLISFFVNFGCDGGRIVDSLGNNKVALAVELEGGGIYCANN